MQRLARVKDQSKALITSGNLLLLIRFRSLRLKPKVAAAPRAGRGPGTEADVEAVSMVRVVGPSRVMYSDV